MQCNKTTDVFKTRIRELRLARNYRLQDVANALNVTIRAISNYEQGIRQPSFEQLVSLCDFFDVSADYLLGRIEY